MFPDDIFSFLLTASVLGFIIFLAIYLRNNITKNLSVTLCSFIKHKDSIIIEVEITNLSPVRTLTLTRIFLTRKFDAYECTPDPTFIKKSANGKKIRVSSEKHPCPNDMINLILTNFVDYNTSVLLDHNLPLPLALKGLANVRGYVVFKKCANLLSASSTETFLKVLIKNGKTLRIKLNIEDNGSSDSSR